MFFTSSFLFLVSSLRFDFFKSSALWALASTRWTSARASSRDFNTPFTSYRRADWYGLLCCSLIKTYRGWTYSIQIILKTSTKVLKKICPLLQKKKIKLWKIAPFLPQCKVPGLFSFAAPESGLWAPGLCSRSLPCWLASWRCCPASLLDSLLTSAWSPLHTQTARPHTAATSAGSHASASGIPDMMIVPVDRGRFRNGYYNSKNKKNTGFTGWTCGER